jgi:hypothetical protein
MTLHFHFFQMNFKLLSALVTGIQSATIAQLLSQNPGCTKMNALAAKNPAWADPQAKITLVAPTDDAITKAGNGLIGSGYLQTNNVLDTKTHYIVLTDIDGDKKMIWDNYEPDVIDRTPVVHLRSGLGDGLVNRIVPADNGMLIVSDIAINPPSPPSQSWAGIGCSKFGVAIEKAGLKELVDGLRGVTM